MTPRRHHIGDDRHDVLRQMLEERRREIQSKLRSILDTLPAEIDLVRDVEEQSVVDFVRDVDFALMQMKSETLAKIDEALRRLEEGGYGLCVDCERDIPPARLQALPFADRCRECQERHEGLAGFAGRPGRETFDLGGRLREGQPLPGSREAKHE